MTLKVTSITIKIFKVHITYGSHIEDYAFIPRIEASPSDSSTDKKTISN